MITLFKKILPKKSCLHGKTEKQKCDFFQSLYKCKNKDVIFYNEQLRDLKYDEMEQFNMWIFNNKYKK